jgi:HSP20 family protein
MRTYYPFQEIEALRREIDRAFAGVSVNGERTAPVAFLPGRSARAYPLLNVSEDRDRIFVQALAPGIDPQSINVTLQKNSLTISGEKLAPKGVKAEAFHRSERAAGRFTRTIELPVDVDSNRIEARYQDGLLAIILPKSEEAKPRQINVAVA